MGNIGIACHETLFLIGRIMSFENENIRFAAMNLEKAG